jgi:WD40 repeat protein/predicted Ser/Thr protein kinase
MICPFCGAEVGNATVCPWCGANFGAPSGLIFPHLPLGTKLLKGKYTVGKVLGQGGFGITYKGADTTLFRPVAIKEFFPEGCQRKGTTVQPTHIPLSEFAQMRQRFLEEARVLASLSHPNIVKIFDFFEENNTAYMVMEYLSGKSLAKVLGERGGVLGEQEAVGYILKVCEALEVVHRAGYLHRDIKPENIIICDDGRVVLVDFGAAREYVAGKTGRMSVILTPGYAPLEQYAEKARRGAYTDIYALGATLYHLLTGLVPVSAPDRATGVELKSVREVNPGVSEGVSEAVMKAMAMRVEERPQSVDEFVRLLKGPSVSALAVPKVSVPAGAKGVWREVVTLRHGSWVHSVSFSPDGKFLASGGPGNVKVLEVGSWREVATLRGHRVGVHSVSFSPDGQFLASGSHIVKVWRVGSWQEIATLRGHRGYVNSLAFSPDGKFLASGEYDNTVPVWEVGSWHKVATLKGHWDIVFSVSFSPDGKFLASGGRDNRVRVWEVGSWWEIAELRYDNFVLSVTFSPEGNFLALGVGDGTVRVLEVGSWREVATLRGYRLGVLSVSFSPDGKFVASGGEDGTVRVWEVGSWREVVTLSGHEGSVRSVSFSPDGKFLASGSFDNTLKVWEVSVV